MAMKRNRDMLEKEGVEIHVLLSFNALIKWEKSFTARVASRVIAPLKESGVKGMFLDSGVFPINRDFGTVGLTQQIPFGNRKTISIRSLCDNYVRFVKAFGGQFERVADLDIIPLDDQTYLMDKREELFSYVPKSLVVGIHAATVEAHGGLDKLSKKYPYFGANRYDLTLAPDFGKAVCERMRLSGLKVHGYGCTTPKLLATFPFDSVDSQSWSMPFTKGRFMKFDGSKFRSVSISHKSREFSKTNSLMVQNLAIYAILEQMKMTRMYEQAWEGKRERKRA